MQHDERSHIPVAVRSAGVVVLDSEKRILLVREMLASKAGLWHIPAGTVENGETLEEAALREAKEETGLELELTAYLNTYLGRFPSGDLVMRHVWMASPTDDQEALPILGQEISECRYIAKPVFDDLYQQGRIRMYQTKLMFEDALVLAAKMSFLSK